MVKEDEVVRMNTARQISRDASPSSCPKIQRNGGYVTEMSSPHQANIGLSRFSLNAALLWLLTLTCGCNQFLGIEELPEADAGPMSSGGSGGGSGGSAGGSSAGGSPAGGNSQGGTAGPDAGPVEAACFAGQATQGPSPESLAALGGTGEDIMSDIAMDGVNRVVAGSFTGTLQVTSKNVTETLVAMDTDALVLKTDAAGKPLWAIQFGGAGKQDAYAVTVDRLSNIYVAGGFAGTTKFGSITKVSNGGFDIFVAKLSPDGAVVWVRTYGAAKDDYVLGLATTSDNEVLATGAFEVEESFGTAVVKRPKNADAFLMRMKPNGDTAWVETFGGLGNDQGVAVAVNDKDQIAFQGIFTSRINVGGTEIFLQDDLPGTHSVFLTLRSSSGAHVWSVGMGGGEDLSGRVTFDGKGHLISSGTFTDVGDFGNQTLKAKGTADSFVARISPTGNFEWVRHFGGPMGSFGYGVIANETSVFFAGSFWQSSSFDGINLAGPLREGVLAKLDLCTGNVVWSKSFGGAGVDEGYALAFDPAGKVVMVGTYEGQMSFGNKMTAVDVGVGEIFMSTSAP